MNRRKFILSALLASMSQHALAKSKPTPSQPEGPFYPLEPIPRLNNLIERAGGSAAGERLALDGTVMGSDGSPLTGVLVEIWQCDASGRYRHPRDGDISLVDRHFAGFGSTETGAAGKYRFSTLLPVPYTGRPPHIHVKLHRGSHELLTTQLYLKKAKSKGVLESARGWFYGDRDALTIDPEKAEFEGWQARFDFVVNVAN